MERSERWGEAGRLVLGFDARCTRCAGLASIIRRCAGDRLEVGDLRSARARRWRERALGHDAPWVPTLFEVRGGDVRAWSGIEMGLVLAHRLGPADGLKVLRALGEAGVARGGATRGRSPHGESPPAKLRAVARSLPETVSGAVLALDVLKGGAGSEQVPGCTRSRRRETLRVLRGSKAYQDLIRTLRVDLDLRRAAFVAGGEPGLTGVIASGAGRDLRLFTAFLVDLHRGSLDACRYLTVTEADGERVIVEHRGRETGETLILGDDYVVLPDGRWVTPEEFEERGRDYGPDRHDVEEDMIYRQEERSLCLRRSYDFCLRVADLYRASWQTAPGLGSLDAFACEYLIGGPDGSVASCRAWARTRCYLREGNL